MTWNYRVIRSVDAEGEPLYSVHEVYYDKDGKPDSWTCDPVFLSAESVQQLIKDVVWILKSLTEPVLEVVDDKLIEVSATDPSAAEGER